MGKIFLNKKNIDFILWKARFPSASGNSNLRHKFEKQEVN